MIINGAAKPSRIVSNRLTLDQAPGAFEKFDARRDGYIKVVLKPL
jgi:glutathione-independent formaldehyde dehydrogenase